MARLHLPSEDPSHWPVATPKPRARRAPTQLALPVAESEVGDAKVFTIVLPFLPPSKNGFSGLPPQWKNGVKAKWKRHILRACQEAQMPLGNPRIGLAAKLVFSSARRRDPQNYAEALWNWVPDALQEAGVLLDDRHGAVQWAANLGVEFAVDKRKIDPKSKQRTILSIAIPMGGRKEPEWVE